MSMVQDGELKEIEEPLGSHWDRFKSVWAGGFALAFHWFSQEGRCKGPCEVCVITREESEHPHRDEFWAQIEAIRDAEPGVVVRDVYPRPPDGWVCFHCGERFTSYGSAEDHFGARPEDKPACLIKLGEERGLLMALRRAEARIRELDRPSPIGLRYGQVLEALEEGMAAVQLALETQGNRGAIPHRTWKAVIWQSQSVMRLLASVATGGETSPSDDPFWKLADHLDLIHSELVFREGELDLPPETVAVWPPRCVVAVEDCEETGPAGPGYLKNPGNLSPGNLTRWRKGMAKGIGPLRRRLAKRGIKIPAKAKWLMGPAGVELDVNDIKPIWESGRLYLEDSHGRRWMLLRADEYSDGMVIMHSGLPTEVADYYRRIEPVVRDAKASWRPPPSFPERPSWEQTLAHMEGGGVLGMLPGSVGLALTVCD